jgi:hypothetical protein
MWSLFRRTRWQFRLTTLLVVMAVIAACSAIYGARVRALEQQEEAFRQIASKGGWIHIGGQTSVFFERPLGVCYSGVDRVIEPVSDPKPFTDEDMDALDKVPNLWSVNFHGTRVTPRSVGAFRMRKTDCHVSMNPR